MIIHDIELTLDSNHALLSHRLHFKLLWIFLMISAFRVSGQELSNLREKTIAITDTVLLDTLSIIPGSINLNINGQQVDSTFYVLDPIAGLLIWNDSILPSDSAIIIYRTFPLSFTEPLYNKSPDRIAPRESDIQNPFVYRPEDLARNEDIFGLGGMDKSGSISRGVGFGNNQDLTVNSGLNLSLSGKITDNISILASVTDNNIPIQPEGNTAQLQDFDQVYIQLFDDKNRLTVGDFQLHKPPGHFMNYFKRAQGGSFETRQLLDKSRDPSAENNQIYLQASAAVSKGKWSRQVIIGTEGNQGPYRLRGAEGEEFIIVLAGTERVYIDGRLMQRGQENDYIIDYNSAELIFTPNQLITKDRRITVEFQYSERNFTRTMVQLATGINAEKYDVYLNVYSEQDSKNQSLQQDLTQADRSFLSTIGNDIQSAVVPAIDSVAFNNEQILYMMTDSLGYDSVFVYSTDPETAQYQLSFSNVGQGNGDYLQDGFGATGRIFKWMAPDTVGGQVVRNGRFEPVILLVTPKKKQLIAAGGRWKIAPETSLGIELAASNSDLNTFSTIDNDENTGVAALITWDNRNNLQPKNDQHPLYINTIARYELVESRFEPIERFRAVEFDRDWNITDLDQKSNQHRALAGVGIEKRDIFRLDYQLESFNAVNAFEGLKNQISANLDYKRYFLDFQGSILRSSGNIDTRFDRHRTTAIKKFKWFNVGYVDELEKNTFSYTGSDSMAANSYAFHEWEVYIGNPDTSFFGYRVFYSQRTDRRSYQNDLVSSEFAEQYGVELAYSKDPRHQLRSRIVHRQMKVLNEETAISEPENTLLGNINYDMRVLKGALNMNLYYEIGSGLERAREFIYVHDPTGQGPYTWIDYNGNNVQELNEFELARPEDGNRYLRIFTPTDNYVRAFTNQYSHSINWNPVAIWGNKRGVLKLLSKVSDQLAFRIDRKTRGETGMDRFNPFITELADTALISANTALRNTVFFNRSHSKYGVDYTFGRNSGKSLLTNGFDSRNTSLNEVKVRYNISRVFGVILRGEQGERSNSSDFLSGRNYKINYNEIEPSVSYQPNTSLRGTLKFRFTEKDNDADLGGEKAILQDLGVELRYNQVSKGSLLAQVNMVNIRFSGAGNSSLTYEMLEGLRAGTNFTWSVSYQRTLGKNIQLNLSYNGRKSEELNAVHSGGVQLRAYF